MGFDIMNLQKGRGAVQARSKADEGRAVLKYIDVDDLVPSEDNFYSMSAIDELATLIELSGGVKQPALVVPMGGGKYRVIAGHRRRLASLRLVKQGKEAYRKMPCMVDADEREPGADADELRAIDEAILLITTNGQREKTDWDKVQEATRLRELLDQKRRFEKIPGETRKLIAEQLGTTPAQVGRYDSIAKHLAAPFKHLLEMGKVNISVAYELSTLDNGEQYAIYETKYLTQGGLSIEDVKRWKLDVAEKEKIIAAAKEREKLQPGTVAEDEPGPEPPEQVKELLDHAGGEFHCEAGVEDCRTCFADGQCERQAEQTETAENAGKVVNFPAPPSPAPAHDSAEPKEEPMHQRRAAYILEDLQMYCEEMLGIEAGQADTWAERADALAVAIAVLRK